MPMREQSSVIWRRVGLFSYRYWFAMLCEKVVERTMIWVTHIDPGIREQCPHSPGSAERV
jgi:hypothetical protein